MARHKPVDADGNPIDPSKNLEEFVQRMPSSVVEEVKAAPSWEAVKFESDDPDLSGKTGKEVASIVAERRQQVEAAAAKTQQLEQQLAAERERQRVSEITRSVLAEQERQRVAIPPQPVVDPREEQIDDLWFKDPPAARRLMQQVDEERRQKFEQETEAKLTEKVQQHIFGQLSVADKRRQGQQAFESATQRLVDSGVTMDQLNRRAKAVLREVIDPAGPYYAKGGPLVADNLIAAHNDLFGEPEAGSQPPQKPAAQVQPPAPVVAPPGSGRPAPAATTSRKKDVRMSAQENNEIEHLANVFNLNPEKLAARRRARMGE